MILALKGRVYQHYDLTMLRGEKLSNKRWGIIMFVYLLTFFHVGKEKDFLDYENFIKFENCS